MNNIFENAKFGDKFKTREEWYAVYDGQTYFGPCGKGHLVHELRYRGKDNKYCITVLRCENNGLLADKKRGKHPYDIVGKWQEPIDEEELDKLTEKEMNLFFNVNTGEMHYCTVTEKEAFKAGYRKALEK